MKGYTAELEKSFRDEVKSLGFFDANCWIGRPNFPGPYYLHGVEEIAEHLDYCGIERAMVSHALARFSHPLVGNDLLLKAIDGFPKLTGSFVLLPGATGEFGSLDGYLDSMLKANVRAVRLFPKSHNYSLGDWTCSDLLSRLEERLLPLFIWPRETDWDTLYEVSSKYARLPVVLEQCEEEAYWNLRYLVPLLERCANVRVETAKGHLYLGIDEIVRRFGAGRVIFGSNTPIDDPFASLMLVTGGDFPEDDKRRIAHGNLDTLLSGVKT